MDDDELTDKFNNINISGNRGYSVTILTREDIAYNPNKIEYCNDIDSLDTLIKLVEYIDYYHIDNQILIDLYKRTQNSHVWKDFAFKKDAMKYISRVLNL